MDADQKQRIAANKAAALAKLAAKKKRKSDQEKTQPKKPRTADDCATCGALADAAFRAAFSISTCNACRRRDPSLDLLNATDAAKTYLLPQATLKCLPTLERENPRQPTWTPMRLFLRRHLVEHANRRWGDEAGLEAERRRRAAAKVKRDDAKAKDFFS